MAILFIVLLGSCGGDEKDTFVQTSRGTTPVTETKKAESATIAPAPSDPYSFSKTNPDGTAQALEDAMQLVQLAKNLYLSKMRQDEILAFRNQLKNKSAYEREALIDKFPSLSDLPVQQKQILLGQLAQIVPVETPSSVLTCVCENNLMREICVKEACGETHALAEICRTVCGSASRPIAACKASQQCSGK
jgi:hypothetical protein